MNENLDYEDILYKNISLLLSKEISFKEILNLKFYYFQNRNLAEEKTTEVPREVKEKRKENRNKTASKMFVAVAFLSILFSYLGITTYKNLGIEFEMSDGVEYFLLACLVVAFLSLMIYFVSNFYEKSKETNEANSENQTFLDTKLYNVWYHLYELAEQVLDNRQGKYSEKVFLEKYCKTKTQKEVFEYILHNVRQNYYNVLYFDNSRAYVIRTK